VEEAMKDYSLKAQAEPKKKFDIELFSDEELMELRNQIDARLHLDMRKVNLTEELGLQYRHGKILLETISTDTDTKPNQKAQVFNSVVSMLDKIIDQRRFVYSAERLKRFEEAFLRAARILPTEAREAFFDMYKEHLDDKGA
jgi:hypothetical protein